MTRFQFARAARPELLAELVAAGFPADTPVAFDGHPDAAGLWVDGTTCWVTCAPEQFAAAATVVAAHDVAALNAADAAARADDTSDRQVARLAVAVLLSDAARLEDTTQALSAQVIRNHLARTNKAVAALLRHEIRGGL